jgi:hypothetical protein
MADHDGSFDCTAPPPLSRSMKELEYLAMPTGRTFGIPFSTYT